MMDETTAEQTWAKTTALTRDLKPRILSGLLLALVAVGLAYAGPLSFALLVVAVGLLMCWEWGRIVRGEGFDIAFVAHSVAVLAASIAAARGFAAIGLIVVLIGAIIVLLMRFGRQGRLSGLGVLYVGLPAVALLWIRSDEPHGFKAVMFVLLVVWATDTFAYLGGRIIGGSRLWPRVSPNKTWAGLICGITGATFMGVLFALPLAGASIWRLAASALVLGLVSQAGDLAESALKRGFGVKDASSLIPGHGGFLDRVDGVVPAAVAAALLGLLLNFHAPAQAILFWS
jgi:phosphatidate cytidylyltransferase